MKIKITSHHASFIEDFNNAMDSRQITPTTASDSAMNPTPTQPTGIIGETCGQPLHDLVHRTQPSATPEPKPITSLNAEEAERMVDKFWKPSAQRTPLTEAVVATAMQENGGEYLTEDLLFHARALETELAAAKAECERLRTLNDNAGSALQWAKEELARLRADVERWSGGLDMSLPDLYEAAKSDRDKANAELARLRAEVEKLTIADHAWRTAAKFDAHNAEVLQTEIERLKEGRPVVSASLYDETLVRAERAEAEVERLKKRIKDDNRSYGCELRDPNGTIWEQAAKDHARAEKAEAENERLKELGDKWAIDARNEAERAERAELELAAARKEIEVLRWWGNKDCTAMADAALKGIIP